MTTADIISLTTLIVTFITLVIASITLIPLLKLFLALSIAKRKNRIFYLYKLLSPDLFKDKSKINEMEKEIWNRLYESLFNICLSASREFVIDKFTYEKNNKEWLVLLGIERLTDLIRLRKNLNKLKKKLKFIAREISKARILRINKNCRYDVINFSHKLSSDEIRILKIEKIYPINYYKSYDFYQSFPGCYEKQQQDEKEQKEEENFELKTILRNTNNGTKCYIKEIKEKKFSILVCFSINSHEFQLLLNFDRRKKWEVKKLNKSHLNLNSKAHLNVRECIQTDNYSNKIEEILNSEN